MDVLEYYDSIANHVNSLAEVDGEIVENQFLEYCLDILVDAGECEEYNLIEDGRDARGRWRVDAAAFDEESKSFNLFISMFDQAERPSNLTASEIANCGKKLQGFLKLVATEEPHDVFIPTGQAYNTATELRQRWADIRGFKFFIISNKPLSKRIDSLPEQSMFDKPVDFHIWDLDRFFSLEKSGREREEMIIDFQDSPLSCLVTGESHEQFTSLLAVMPGETLFQLYEKWGARLLEQNVRSYLQNRSNVNKGIRITIKDDPEKFFAYNNGLTTTAEAIEFTDESRTAIQSLRNFQIVNGGQTTSSIYAAAVADKVDVSRVSVQMKLTVVEPEKVGDIVPFISRFANSQNKVSDADLFSNHPFHIHFEEMSRRITCQPKAGSATSTHWFYERARGQYLDQQAYLPQSQRKAFQKQNPRDQLLTKTDLAKIENTWRMYPADVSKGAQANFKKFAEFIDTEWSKSKDNFGEGYFKKCVVHARIFRDLEIHIKKQDWYGGFRANIVTYTISLFAKGLKDMVYSLNYDFFFRTQTTPIAMLDYLADIGLMVDRQLKSFSGNLTTYAKGSQAWKDIQNNISLPEMGIVKEYLWDKNEKQEYEKDSKATQKIDSSLQIEIEVQSLQPSQWDKVKQFLIDTDEATETTIGLLTVAKSKRGLTSKQCIPLYKLLEKYRAIKGEP